MRDSGGCLYSTFMVLHLEGNSFFWGLKLEPFCPWISILFFLFVFVHSPLSFFFKWAANTWWPHFLGTLQFACGYLEETSPSPPQCRWLFLLLKMPLRNLSFKPPLPRFYSGARHSWGSGFNIHRQTPKLLKGVHVTPPEMLGGPTSG